LGERSERVQEAVDHLRRRGFAEVDAAVVLGSGLSRALPLEDPVSAPFEEVPHFPRGRVAGHERRVEYGRVAGARCLVLRGRVHAYEGADLVEATRPVRVARALGARWIALTNAAGALRPLYDVGDLVAITDHLNLMGDGPLAGPNDDALGTRFPDLSSAYDPELLRHADEAARAEGTLLRRGVYAAVAGPQYETAAELRMLRTLGADLVGMSTVPEAIAAVHGGMRVLALSVVTDLAFAESPAPLAHADVVAAAERAAPRVSRILEGVLGRRP
jgi:purine-nucleoside phosphorylase